MGLIKPDANGFLFRPDPSLAMMHAANRKSIISVFEKWMLGNDGKGMFAGYTYWGQFIAHDVAPRVGSDRKRSSSLDLDSLYGSGWYDREIALNTAEGKFLTGFNTADGVGDATRMDLFRRADKTAVIPEPRNEDNLILSQFHLLLQRFHNKIVDGLKSLSPALSPQVRFKMARNNVERVFRRLVIENFLEHVCDKNVYEHVIKQGNRYFKFKKNTDLPMEFSAAIFRFGHSLVRQDYHLNDVAHNVSLKEIFGLTGPGGFGGRQSLPAGKVVDWKFFFPLPPILERAAGAGRIDPFIEEGMYKIPAGKGKTVNIVEKNLDRGIETMLASGQSCVSYILEKYKNLSRDIGLHQDNHITRLNQEQIELLTNSRVLDCTPLWLYVLLEAKSNYGLGACLGPFASLLVCESIRSACENSQATESFELPELSNLHSMSDLIAWVG
ncbi:MAG: hypothetical protein MRY76_00410 [Pseudomonadales bacterium]|nr:hypothetical protein [Pseudomonadales bacterium]